MKDVPEEFKEQLGLRMERLIASKATAASAAQARDKAETTGKQVRSAFGSGADGPHSGATVVNARSEVVKVGAKVYSVGECGRVALLAGRGGINACKVSLRKGEGSAGTAPSAGAFGYAAKPTGAAGGGGGESAAASVIQKGLQKKQIRENRDARKDAGLRRSLML